MGYVTEPFQAFLAKSLDASEVYLPLAASPYADLLKLLKEKCTYTYLTIKDDTHLETVKAYAEGGYILLERGLAGTQPYKFSYGACVATIPPTILAVLSDMTKDFSERCCYYENPDAMNTELEVAQISGLEGKLGEDFWGYIIFSGALPINIEIDGVPAWARVEQCGNMVDISGVPDTRGSFVIHAKATNCGGTATVERNISMTID